MNARTFTESRRTALPYHARWHWGCKTSYAMKDILLCSSNTLMVRNLYGILRDLGFHVDMVEHPSRAVHAALERRYDYAIIDAEPFGLSSDEAEQVLRTVAPDMPVVAIGLRGSGSTARSIDLEAFTRALHAFAT